MNLQVGTAKILKLYHPQAHALFLKFNHLTRVIELVESGKAESAMIDVTEVFQPIRSMLCQKFTPTLNKDFLQKEMFQETKMDGERFQIHVKNGEFRYFSRNSHEFSEGFNEMLTPLIKFAPVVHSLILDGEMLVYDKDKQRYHTKGETTIDVKYMKDLKQKHANLRPCFCAFDVLLYNDQDLMNRPYTERFQLLHQLFQDREGVLVKTIPIKIRDNTHLVELFNKAFEAEEEGVVLKDAQSEYKPGDRAGGWYKVKADYFDGDMAKEFDCVIIGGYYKTRYQKDFIQKYMLGAVEAQEDGTINVYAVGEVVHGVSSLERMKINDSLKSIAIDHAGESEIPFSHGKIFFGKNKPHVWMPPNKSIVLQCRVSELAPSWEFYTKYTFRFPRIEVIRNDKIWDESCTMKEFNEMCKGDAGRVKKVVQRSVNENDIISPKRKRKQGATKKSIIEQFCQNFDDDDELEVIDSVLDGKQFSVITKDPKLTSNMTRIVKMHGGTISKYPSKKTTYAIITDEITKKVQAFMKENEYIVLKVEWLLNNFGEKGEKVLKEMPKMRPVFDLLHITDALQETFRDVYSKFGDSFTEPVTVDELKVLVAATNKERNDPSKAYNFSKPTDEELAEFDAELVSAGGININFFRCVSGAFLTTRDDNYLFEISKQVFEFRGGRILKLEEEAQRDVMIFTDKRDGVEKIIKELSSISIFNYKLVDFHWITDSSTAGKQLEREKYEI